MNQSDFDRLVALGEKWPLPLSDDDLEFDVPFLLQAANRLYGALDTELLNHGASYEEASQYAKKVINGE